MGLRRLRTRQMVPSTAQRCICFMSQLLFHEGKAQSYVFVVKMRDVCKVLHDECLVIEFGIIPANGRDIG